MKKITISLAAAALALTACGGSDGDSGPDAVAGFMAVAEEGGIELDKECVEEAAEGLSDADAEVVAGLVDNPNPDDLDISEAGDVIGDRIFDECIVGGDE